MNDRTAITNRVIAVGLVRALGLITSFGLTVTLGRFLGAESFAIYGIITIVMALARVPVANGYGAQLLRLVRRVESPLQWASARALQVKCSQISLAVSLACFTLGIVTDYLIEAANDGHAPAGLPTILGISVALYFDQLAATRLAILRGLDRPVAAQLPDVFIRPATTLIALFLFWRLRGQCLTIHDAVFALIIGSASAYAWGSVSLHREISHRATNVSIVPREHTWTTSAFPLSIAAFLVIGTSYSDMLMIALYVDLETAGTYRVAAQIAVLSSFGYTAVNMIAAERFARSLATTADTATKETAKHMARLAVLGTLPLPIIFASFGSELIRASFGAEFIGALSPLGILFIGTGVNAAVGMPQTLLIMQGHESLVARLAVLPLVLNVALGVVLIPTHGTLGAATSTVLATGTWNVALWREAKRRTGIDTSAL